MLAVVIVMDAIVFVFSLLAACAFCCRRAIAEREAVKSTTSPFPDRPRAAADAEVAEAHLVAAEDLRLLHRRQNYAAYNFEEVSARPQTLQPRWQSFA